MKEKNCFRPLTGILFFNGKGIHQVHRYVSSRFRPLTGILFFNSCTSSVVCLSRRWFPSPYGDFVFQQI